MNYLIWGMSADENFGVVSLVSGTCYLIRNIDKNAVISYSQLKKPLDKTLMDLNDLNIKVINSESGIRLLLDALLYRLNLKKNITSEYLREIANSDVIIDSYGIYFCNRFNKEYKGYFNSLKSIYQQFQICILGKILGKKIVKTSASYGPIVQKQDILSAKIAVRYIFNKMFAREKTGKKELEKYSKKPVFVAPDVANIIPFTKNGDTANTVGIAVSSQIIHSWKTDESYIEDMVKLIEHIRAKYKMTVVLYPNEIHSKNPYNDYHLSKDIAAFFIEDSFVTVFDSKNKTYIEQRNSIASCGLFISSRYHGCVASLSAGVPTMVVGWHSKYNELMELYNQSDFMIEQEIANSNVLKDKFDELFKNKESIEKELQEKGKIIKGELCNVYRSEFE